MKNLHDRIVMQARLVKMSSITDFCSELAFLRSTAEAFRGAGLQLFLPKHGFSRKDLQTALNPVGVTAARFRKESQKQIRRVFHRGTV